jgi:hypothetical protein
MKNVLALTILVLALNILGIAQAQGVKPLSVAPDQVQRVEILYFPERVLVRAALTPERLEQLYQYKLEIRKLEAFVTQPNGNSSALYCPQHR